jgi:hypothetical protein
VLFCGEFPLGGFMTTETKTLRISRKFEIIQYPNCLPDLICEGYDMGYEIELDKETSLAIINFLKEAHNLKGEVYD